MSCEASGEHGVPAVLLMSTMPADLVSWTPRGSCDEGPRAKHTCGIVIALFAINHTRHSPCSATNGTLYLYLSLWKAHPGHEAFYSQKGMLSDVPTL